MQSPIFFSTIILNVRYYHFKCAPIVSNSGSQLSSSISKNSKIQEATKKALDYANKIKDLK